MHAVAASAQHGRADLPGVALWTCQGSMGTAAQQRAVDVSACWLYIKSHGCSQVPPTRGPYRQPCTSTARHPDHSVQHLPLMTSQVLQGKQAIFQVLQSQHANALQLVPIEDAVQPAMKRW